MNNKVINCVICQSSCYFQDKCYEYANINCKLPDPNNTTYDIECDTVDKIYCNWCNNRCNRYEQGCRDNNNKDVYIMKKQNDINYVCGDICLDKYVKKYRIKNKKCNECQEQGYLNCEVDNCDKYTCFQCFIKCRECSKKICKNCEILSNSEQDPDHYCYDCYMEINNWTKVKEAVLYRLKINRKKI